jgi:hypothetical protein
VTRARLALLILALALVLAGAAQASVPLTRVSSDPYTNVSSQHRTEVEPDTFANGSTIVGTFQVGRFFDGGASNIGWATSTNSGSSWSHGFLPGITVYQGGAFDRVSDPSVAYDARHNTWIISSLAINGTVGVAVVVSRSTNGGLTWSNPVTVASKPGGFLDKNWTVCDNTSTSPFYGRCYTQWDDATDSDRIKMSTSTNGALTWGAAQNTADNATGLGGQPVVQPSGTVIVPIDNASETAVRSFRSTDGGATWSTTTTVSNITKHTVAGGLRAGPLPSAEVDGAGKVYVVWQDCRFRTSCSANDIVMSTSTNGLTWSAVKKIPIYAATGKDHFIPGLGVDKATSGTSARLLLFFHFYPNAACDSSTCRLYAGYSTSTNGGATWSAPTQIVGPMPLSRLPNTNQGRMFGDYVSSSILAGGKGFPVIPVASTTTNTAFNQNMYAPTGGLTVASGTSARTASAAGGRSAPQAPAGGARRPKTVR